MLLDSVAEQLAELRKKNGEPHQLRVLGMDPSFRNWGYAVGAYNVESGELHIDRLQLISTSPTKSKSVRASSDDLRSAVVLHGALETVLEHYDPLVVFSEVPAGAQSATAAKGLGIAVGVMASCKKPLVQVTPNEVKLALTGNKKATKREMIEAAYRRYPDAQGWRTREEGGAVVPVNEMEHLADAVGAIHAGIATPQFNEILAVVKGMS